MIAQEEIPSDKQCKDKFQIQSIVVPPSTTTQNVTPKMFDEKERRGKDFELGVVYTFPSPIPDAQSSTSEISKAPSSLEESEAPPPLKESEAPPSLEEAEVVSQREEVPLNNNSDAVKTNWTTEFGDLCIKGIIGTFSGLIFWHLVTKLMFVIWSTSFVVVMLVVRMIQNVVSDSFEDWIMKGLAYVFFHFMTVVFRRKKVDKDAA